MTSKKDMECNRRFEDSLLIVKPDFMHKRKNILLYLTQCEFQLQARRVVAFTPEHAAEFYKNSTDEKLFMLQVILLSKGNSEAFIFTGENGVESLRNTMICYFRSSVEMERHVHVSKSPEDVRHEVTFIFPNYIYEPIPYYDRDQFCKQPFLKPLMDEVIHALDKSGCDPEVNWKLKLAEHLNANNPDLPIISNECCIKPQVGIAEKGLQTSMTMMGKKSKPEPESPKSSHTLPCVSSSRSSRLLSTSSCISCGGFSSEKPDYPCADFLAGKVEPLDLSPRPSVHTFVEEHEPVVDEEDAGFPLSGFAEAIGENEVTSLSMHDSDLMEIMYPPQQPQAVDERQSEPPQGEAEDDAILTEQPEAAEEVAPPPPPVEAETAAEPETVPEPAAAPEPVPEAQPEATPEPAKEAAPEAEAAEEPAPAAPEAPAEPDGEKVQE